MVMHLKSKVQKLSPRLHKLFIRAHKVFKKEYPRQDANIQPVFLKGDETQLLCKKPGKDRRFAKSFFKRGKGVVIFDVGLDKMPDDFVFFHFLHELIHAGFGETDESVALSITFDVLKKLGIDRDDFMQRYQHLLAKSSQ